MVVTDDRYLVVLVDNFLPALRSNHPHKRLSATSETDPTLTGLVEMPFQVRYRNWNNLKFTAGALIEVQGTLVIDQDQTRVVNADLIRGTISFLKCPG